MNLLNCEDVVKASRLIENHIKNTPIISNLFINKILNSQVFFKMDSQQVTQSFKARGAFNAVLAYYQKHCKFPKKIVVQSSGNHAQAAAYVGKKFNIPVLIYMANTVSPYKVMLSRQLGAEVVLCEKRSIANAMAEEKQRQGYFFIHPSDNDDVIAGQGSCVLEALKEIGEVSAIFAPCGGGGLLAGSYLASQQLSANAKIIGCEPLMANDACNSLKLGKIIGFEDTPPTIADGARTLKVSLRCFEYLKKITGIIEIPEEKIIYWQKYLTEILQEKIEPTSALSIAGLELYLQRNISEQNQKFLIIISGGNIEI
jgi:threonine dehydratase